MKKKKKKRRAKLYGCFAWKELKVAHRRSTIRRQNLEWETYLFSCPHSSPPFITPARTVPSMHFQQHRTGRPQSPPFLLQLLFFFFFEYLVKMSIGCFYVLWPVSHKINPDMTEDPSFIYFLQSTIDGPGKMLSGSAWWGARLSALPLSETGKDTGNDARLLGV